MRWKVIAGSGLLLFLIAAVILWRRDSSTRTLPDGTRIILSSVRIGRTNLHSHGNLLSKALGRFAPSNGITIARYTIQQPKSVALQTYDDSDILSAQFQVFPAPGRENHFLRPPFYRKFRILIIGEDGFSYVKEFFGQYEFRKYSDGIYAYVYADTWPRTSRTLRIRLEDRPSSSSRDFREVASFTVRNPKRIKAESWEALSSFKTTLANEVDVEIGELIVRTQPIHPSDIWEHTAELPVRFSRAGQVLTNWGLLSDSRITDATGNRSGLGALKVVTNGLAMYRFFRPIDPAHPWRFNAHFGLDSDFPATNLFHFTIPWQMRGTNATNFAGVPVNISYVHTSMLVVELPTHPKGLRVAFVSAFGDHGANANDHSGSWGQHHFWRSLNSWGSSNIHATIAIHANHPASFTLRPRYEASMK